MSDEDIFNEWKSEQYKDQSTEEKMELVEHLHTFPQYFKKTFLAGLKAGKDMAETDLATIAYMQGAERYKLKWHDLRKNPKDLPEPHSTVLDENGDKIIYRGGDMWTVYSEYYEKGIDAEPPKAWCEVPTFEE